MNDDGLMTAVKDSFAGVHLDIPAEQIAGRGRALRARRRLPGLAAGALAVAGAMVLAVTALLPVARHPGPRLAAWTVAKRADGTIQVTIREMRDPAGLQRKLRADGVPAAVTFFSGSIPRCRPFTERVSYPSHPHERILVVNPGAGVVGYPRHVSLPVVLIIRPTALPAHAGVEIVSGFEPGATVSRRVQPAVGTALVHLSPECTGS
jgi:hypothetical protein